MEVFRAGGIAFRAYHIVDEKVAPEQAREWIADANLVRLAGGPTLTQIANIRFYGLIEPLCERDGLTIGMSAGSINMARRVVYARDVREDVFETSVYEGIGLVEINIEPHLNEADEEHLADIREAARIAPILGLYDDAFVVVRNGRVAIHGTHEWFDERDNPDLV